MKKLVAIIVVGFAFASCGNHLCPAYNGDNFKKENKDIILDWESLEQSESKQS